MRRYNKLLDDLGEEDEQELLQLLAERARARHSVSEGAGAGDASASAGAGAGAESVDSIEVEDPFPDVVDLTESEPFLSLAELKRRRDEQNFARMVALSRGGSSFHVPPSKEEVRGTQATMNKLSQFVTQQGMGGVISWALDAVGGGEDDEEVPVPDHSPLMPALPFKVGRKRTTKKTRVRHDEGAEGADEMAPEEEAEAAAEAAAAAAANHDASAFRTPEGFLVAYDRYLQAIPSRRRTINTPDLLREAIVRVLRTLPHVPDQQVDAFERMFRDNVTSIRADVNTKFSTSDPRFRNAIVCAALNLFLLKTYNFPYVHDRLRFGWVDHAIFAIRTPEDWYTEKLAFLQLNFADMGDGVFCARNIHFERIFGELFERFAIVPDLAHHALDQINSMVHVNLADANGVTAEGLIADRGVTPFLARSLAPHQLWGVEFACRGMEKFNPELPRFTPKTFRGRMPNRKRQRGVILSDEMGLGKTVQALAVMSGELSRDSTGLSQDPTGLSQDPTGLSQDPTGLSQDSTGLSQDPTGLSQDPTGEARRQTVVVVPAAAVDSWMTEMSRWMGEQLDEPYEMERIHRRVELMARDDVASDADVDAGVGAGGVDAAEEGEGEEEGAEGTEDNESGDDARVKKRGAAELKPTPSTDAARKRRIQVRIVRRPVSPQRGVFVVSSSACLTACMQDVVNARVILITYGLLGAYSKWREQASRDVPLPSIGLLICDEAHILKNDASVTYQLVKNTFAATPKVLLLSGTPTTNYPAQELWALLNLLTPDQLGPKRQFLQYFRDKSLMRLFALLSSRLLLQRRKADVLRALPPKTRTIRKTAPLDAMTDLVPEQTMQDLKTAVERVRESRDTGVSSHLEFLRAFHLTGEAKAHFVGQWLDAQMEAYPGRKRLVFAHHRMVLDAVEAWARARHLESVRIDGTTPPVMRGALVRRFQQEETVRVAVLATRAAGVAATLTAADLVLVAQLDWSPEVLRQAEDRAHRIGQTRRVDVVYMVTPGTSDDAVWHLLQRKMRAIREAVNGRARQSMETWEVEEEEDGAGAGAGDGAGAGAGAGDGAGTREADYDHDLLLNADQKKSLSDLCRDETF